MQLVEYYNSIDGNADVLLKQVGAEARAIKFLKKLSSDNTFFELMIGIYGKDYSLALNSCSQLNGIAIRFGFTHLEELCGNLIDLLENNPNENEIQACFKEIKTTYEYQMEMISLL